MLGWLSGTGGGEGAGVDGSETPAPVFAYKAFKNAVLGTPAEVDEDRELTIPIKTLNSTYQRSDNLLKQLEKARSETNEKVQSQEPFPLPKAQPMASPTKSILHTPGTAHARRKTVSFGESVVDNERKRSTSDTVLKKDILSGNISRQWPAPTSDLSKRNRSKLTQSLIDAREQKSIENDDDLFDITSEKPTMSPEKVVPAENQPGAPMEESEDDFTTNLNEPHSQSGKYWKSEYDSYRAKSDREIKKLIKYRLLERSFALKSGTEVLRLTERLKQEEEKVKEMERSLAELAAGMAGKINNGVPENEDMVKELCQRTALTLKHKHKAASLRKTLERHGILDSDESATDNELQQDIAHQLRKAQEELGKLKAENRPSDFKKLKAMADASEKKAAELEKENASLKRDLARVKKEISTYEERRKAKEERLGRRQKTLEARVQQYSERLRDSSKAHHGAQETLQKAFEVEKTQMLDTIKSLKSKLAVMDKNSLVQPHFPTGQSEAPRHSSSASKEEIDTVCATKEPLPNKHFSRDNCLPTNAKRGRSSKREQAKDGGNIKTRGTNKPSPPPSENRLNPTSQVGILVEDDDLSPPNTVKRRQNNIDLLTSAKLSQPHRSRSVSPKKLVPATDSIVTSLSPKPSMIYLEVSQAQPQPKPMDANPPRNMSSKSSGLNRSLSLVPDSFIPTGAAAEKLKSMSPERIAAAQARLQRKSEDAIKDRPRGKENVWAAA
ncbi:hypothetical protein LOZ12_002437 [Ophidiomyces ophidiicola]|uniref:Uncharacterized protein n=1 Tax=Ophidiomyces ophidiicola TaxID=1387563 RepID=A0ACB8UY95_9EURO|nr:hypothetical protein LOZ64_002637 [Ophidiomyces ophidiicola]KAI1949492.1 hypothetical protein LOZ62_002242 [Ophidiomyces ophidiicola]KAI1972517.1 hypothetical protein LOZ56_002413 [Ophidiomyces ophidiicola]KAI2008002.1 hypothetical protein LOZ50_002235 [Ophidiomyces ophidiicola]KAI2026069.1 hypothetical protein LOZ45_003123 [Ophidiomyces ophidiicola]